GRDRHGAARAQVRARRAGQAAGAIDRRPAGGGDHLHADPVGGPARDEVSDDERLSLGGFRLPARVRAGRRRAGTFPRACAALPSPARVYDAEKCPNPIWLIARSSNKNLGVMRLGDPQPMTRSPLYKGQVLVHGLGFSPDRKTLAVVSIASNSVTFIDTGTNGIKHTTYVGRSPHQAFFTHDGLPVCV